MKTNFPTLFQGLGTLAGDYHIQLHPNVKPNALLTHRHVPLPLCSKVTKELDRMEKAGVTSKVTKPTKWFAGMVVVLKKSWKVQICVDLKPPNRACTKKFITSDGGQDFSPASRSRSFFRIRCHKWGLANPFISALSPPHHFYNTNGTLLFQQTPFWNLERTRALSKQDK